jgi:hypothetical protein
MVAGTLTRTDAVRWLVQRALQSPRSRELSIQRLASKVRAWLEMEWGVDAPLSEIVDEVAAIIGA